MMNRIPIIATLVWLWSGGILAADVGPAPKTHVTDRAGVIDPDNEKALIDLLEELDKKTQALILILTVIQFRLAGRWVYYEAERSG